MKIEISSNVANEEKWFPILEVLTMLAIENLHSFDATYASALIKSSWIKSNPRHRETIKLLATKKSTDTLADRFSIKIDCDVRRGGVTNPPKNRTELHPLDAIQFLSTPFQVILENEAFDGAFLLWMAKAVGFARFNDAYRDGRIAFRHAGGKDSITRSAEIFSHGVWGRADKKHSRAMRLWLCAVLDNDAKHPTHRPNSEIIQKTEPHVAFIHELRKRAIESYIPISKLQSFDKSKEFLKKIEALKSLNTEQRAHYHMKRGFKFKKDTLPTKENYLKSEDVSHEEKALYKDVTDENWTSLMEGFGSSLSKIYTEPCHRPNPNDKSMKNTADADEILELIQSIYSRI